MSTDRLQGEAPVAGVVTDRDALEDAIHAGLAARRRVLEEYDSAEIAGILAATARAWCASHYERRRRVADELSATLGLHPNMLAWGLDAIFGAVTEEDIDRWIRAEVARPEALDRAVDHEGRRVRLGGPRVLFHALAGNVPGLAVPAIAAALLARSVCVLRESRRQPLLTRAFLDSLAEVSPDLAAMIVPAVWHPRDTLMEKFVFDWADHVEVTGSDAVIRAIAGRHPRRRVVGHGSRLSLCVLPANAQPHDWKEALVHDVAMYEGQGCLSPHLFLVEGNRTTTERLARLLGVAMERMEFLWPREPRGAEAEAARRAFLSEAEAAAACEPECGLLRGRRDAWAIRIDPHARLVPGPGMRCVTLVPVESLRQVVTLLHESETALAGVSIAADPDSRLFAAVQAEAQRAGANLVCLPGELQRPPLWWQQDGTERLGSLLAWRDEEEPA